MTNRRTTHTTHHRARAAKSRAATHTRNMGTSMGVTTGRNRNARAGTGKRIQNSTGGHVDLTSVRSSQTGANAHRRKSPTTRIPQNMSAAGEMMLTRRNFILAAAGIGGAALVGGGAYMVTNSGKDKGDFSVLEVPEAAVATTENFQQVEWNTCVSLAADLKLDYGTILWCNDTSVACCLLPTETAKPLTQIGMLSLGSGTVTTVLKQAVGQDDGFEIYDARGTSYGLIWTEANILDNVWRVYTAPFSQLVLGEPVQVAEGDTNWEMPGLAAVGNRAFWQVLPKAKGEKSTEDSILYAASFGSTDSTVVYASHGRMCTMPYALQDSLVITPRVDAGAVYYQLLHIDAESGDILDSMTLPGNMRPLEAGYGETGFMFAFDAIYNYGDGIANLGSYAPRMDVQPKAPTLTEEELEEQEKAEEPTPGAPHSTSMNDEYSDVPWFCFGRTPTAAPAWCGKYLMVKSTTAIVGVDLDTEQYFMFDVANGCEDYGEYLASTGMSDTVVTYTNIDHTPVNGDTQKLCRVRVWKAL